MSIQINEIPTAIQAPVQTGSGIPVIIGTAPITNGSGLVNEPILVVSYADAVSKFGHSEEFNGFTLCEAAEVLFKYGGVAPAIFVNVLDPATHKTSVTNESQTFADGSVKASLRYAIESSAVVKSDDLNTTYVLDTDYTTALDSDGYLIISLKSGGAIGATDAVKITYDHLNPGAVTSSDIIGGASAGTNTGLSVINDCFPKLQVIPEKVLAPGFSHLTSVYGAMVAAAANINGMFRAYVLADLDTTAVTDYTQVAAWKSANSFTSEASSVFWPKGCINEGGAVKEYHLSLLSVAKSMALDPSSGGAPNQSPSNKSTFINSTCLKGGTPVTVDLQAANMLQSNGVVTAINFTGWRLWGVNTAAAPLSTDIKDLQATAKLMFIWYGNRLALDNFSNLGGSINKRLINTIVSSENVRLSSLTASEIILGGKLSFLPDQNPSTDLVAGKITFTLNWTPTPDVKNITFTMEYDVSNLNNLF